MTKSRCHCGSVVSALVTRVVFSLHCLVALWRITMVTVGWQPFYWLLLCGLGGLLIETIVTIYVRKGAEYKWFCPSVFFYLATIVPCVWILELDMLGTRLEFKRIYESEKGALNTSHSQIEELRNNLSHSNANNFTLFDWDIQIPDINPSQWVVMLEQLLLFVLILGRWMLPKGDITRDELSQLLLVYIGMAADIIEFFEAFKEVDVKYNSVLVMTILGIWSASLLQFTLVLTATKAKKTRAGFGSTNRKDRPSIVVLSEEDDDFCKCCAACSCCGTEVFGIMTTMFLQDGPFLALRLLLLVKYDVKSYMHIFFTVKNSLVLVLMVYRLFVVFDSNRAEEATDKVVVEPKDRGEYMDLSAAESAASPDGTY